MRAPKRVGYKELDNSFPGFSDAENLITMPLTPRRRYWQMDFNELAIVGAIARSISPKVIFEFGRFDGLTTLCFAKSAPKAHVYTLDLPDAKVATVGSSNGACYNKEAPKVARKRWEKAKVSGRISEIMIDSANFKPKVYAAGSLMNTVDLVFIDANHSYDYVRRDTESALQMISAKGVVLWHDYYKRSFPGVTAYLAEFSENHDVYWIESPGAPDYLETSLCYFLG